MLIHRKLSLPGQCIFRKLYFTKEAVDPGGPGVIILVTGSEVRGFKSGWGRWIFSERRPNNSEYDFLQKGNKAVGPVS